MLDMASYTVAGNMPLTHARILWQPVIGTATGGGTAPENALTDYTYQRFIADAGAQVWTLQTTADAAIDTIIIAAHSLAGKTVVVATSTTTGGSFTTRATLMPADNETIAVMLNGAGGAPLTIRRLRLSISDGDGVTIGIIRAGVALQMYRPVFGGVQPIGLTRAVETRHSISETGQWLGRTIQRQARQTTMTWQNLPASWYRSTFAPFAAALPQTPFGLIQNPARMPESVAWCWTDEVPQPSNMGVRDLMEVALNITGLLA